MYSQSGAPPEPAPGRFENRALFQAVQHISKSLVRRVGMKYGDTVYASLFSEIWGQSQFATIEVLAKKRQEYFNRAHKLRDRSSQNVANSKTIQEKAPILSVEVIRDEDEKERSERMKKLNAARDRLVRILKRVKDDTLSVNERRITVQIIGRPGALDVDALRRLWGVPRVVFEAAELHQYFERYGDEKSICNFYDTHIWGAQQDTRIFNILYWKETACCDQTGGYSSLKSRRVRTISHRIIRKVIKLLLLRRRSPLFEKNMDVATEVVLYALHPDGHLVTFRESALREAGFFQGLQAYEYSRSFTASLQNLALAKLNRMLKDLRAVKQLEAELRGGDEPVEFLSLPALRRYCLERDTLTDRALHALVDRYVRREKRDMRCPDNFPVSFASFIRMYLALVGSSTDPGLKYWFSVLDQDGDGWINIGDVAHFYSERKAESEKRNGIKLAHVQFLWVRLCAMSRVPPTGKGLNLSSLKELGKEEREFMMCALLVRRADEGNLTDVAATLAESDGFSEASVELN
ncbi:unnamed protein product [Agarophyton chilense]|eukprot:gb/GEZJ01001138.1/.p1 GENE.gb/GEZJ01001138.1/~~gb/GEZJ01001138.1/.p1  ORF type:complete len:521 (-),score=67.56 gb/GEZJ01001138.1/:4247-5809(-)